eukprot:7638568-Pyramimonas_sp.AAC.1
MRPNSYDHMRQQSLPVSQVANQELNVMLPMWDFALHHDDGTGARLHPHWGERKVGALALLPRADTVQLLAAGLGGKDGRLCCVAARTFPLAPSVRLHMGPRPAWGACRIGRAVSMRALNGAFGIP